MTATPEGDGEEPETQGMSDPDLDAIGDNHMPDDLRESEREAQGHS